MTLCTLHSHVEHLSDPLVRLMNNWVWAFEAFVTKHFISKHFKLGSCVAWLVVLVYLSIYSKTSRSVYSCQASRRWEVNVEYNVSCISLSNSAHVLLWHSTHSNVHWGCWDHKLSSVRKSPIAYKHFLFTRFPVSKTLVKLCMWTLLQGIWFHHLFA